MKKILHKAKKLRKKVLFKLFNRAFTIVELVVVIAIIGTLAGVVLASVNIYIGKSKDSRVKADVSEIAKSIQMYKIENGTYSGYEIRSDIMAPCDESDYSVNSEEEAFLVYHKLCSGEKYWCSDSTGNSIEIDSIPGQGILLCSEVPAGEDGGEYTSEESQVIDLFDQLGGAANAYFTAMGSYDYLCRDDASFASITAQLSAGSRMTACEDTEYSYGWGGNTNGWVYCVDFYDGLFDNGHYCVDYKNFSGTISNCSILQNQDNCTE